MTFRVIWAQFGVINPIPSIITCCHVVVCKHNHLSIGIHFSLFPQWLGWSLIQNVKIFAIFILPISILMNLTSKLCYDFYPNGQYGILRSPFFKNFRYFKVIFI